MQARGKKLFVYTTSRTVILGILLAIVFSPFGQGLPVPKVEAKVCTQVIIGLGALNKTTTVPDNEPCPEGYNESNPQTINQRLEGETGNNDCNTVTSCIADVVYLFTVGFGSAIAYVAAWMLSISVAFSLQSTAYALDFLSTAWTAVRDLANLFFILILVFIAITIMFKADTSETMKRLAWVIVMALLINFSFFFVRVVIDAGNLLAVQFYNAIVKDAPTLGQSINQTNLQGVVGGVGGQTTLKNTGANTKDLTNTIMGAIGIHTLLNNQAFKKFQAENSTWLVGSFAELIALSFTYVTVGIMFFMLAAAFFVIAIKFIFRVVVLWVALFAAPAALLANTLPQGKKLYQFWQNNLISYTFYPAIFLFLFYILTLLTSQIAGSNGSILGTAFNDVNHLSTANFFTFIAATVAVLAIYMSLVIMMLYVALKGADKIGLLGAGAAYGFGRWATRMGSNTLYGGAAILGRNTLGHATRAAAESKVMRRSEALGKLWSTSDNRIKSGVGTVLARTTSSTRQTLKDATFDARNLPGGQTLKHGLKDQGYGLGPVNYDLGEPKKLQSLEERARRALNRNSPTQQPQTPPPQTPPPHASPSSEKSEKELAALGKIKRAIDEVKYQIGHTPPAGAHSSSSTNTQQSHSSPLPHITDSMDIYTILGAEMNASHEELKRKFRDLAKRLHPDTGAGEDAAKLFQILNAKFDDIRTPEKHAAYNINRARETATNSTQEKAKEYSR